jgi:2-desacetyl-2-hydroxyethyl bacteriochlorophyllide A dehydrogenase
VRAVAFADPTRLHLVELDEPSAGPGTVKLKVHFCGICGSDLHFRQQARMPPGMVPGHEFAGTIAEVGDGVEGWSVGDRVAVNPFVPCLECELCKDGYGYLCPQGLADGIGLGQAQGAYAEWVVVPAQTLHRLPDSVSDRDGALVEPLAVGIHGVSISRSDPSIPVAVLGAGPIGVMTALALRARGYEKVVVVELNDRRRELIAGLGFTAIGGGDDLVERVNEVLGGPPPVVIDCTGHPSAGFPALELVAQRGVVVATGIPNEPTPVPYFLLAVKEAELRGVLAYSDADFAEAIEHLAAGRVPADQVITHIADLEETNDWFDDLLSGQTRQLKVLLKP